MTSRSHVILVTTKLTIYGFPGRLDCFGIPLASEGFGEAYARTKTPPREIAVAEKARILVVDDDLLIRTYLSDTLELFGYEVVMAADGDEALAKVQSDNPDLILLDIMMPKRNGTEVARELKGNPATRGIPIIIVTSLPTMPAGLSRLAEACVQKPLRVQDLMKQVWKLLSTCGASASPKP